MLINSYISLVIIESHEVKARKKRSIIILGKQQKSYYMV
jgi:hypothetical protein